VMMTGVVETMTGVVMTATTTGGEESHSLGNCLQINSARLPCLRQDYRIDRIKTILLVL
jgi:hypothetical protein